MKFTVVPLYIALAVFLVGCETSSDHIQLREGGSAGVKETPEVIAKQIRAAMTAPEILKLKYEGERAQAGVRGIRQREVARPLMRRLIACGKVAEQPLGQLLADEDESVRRSCVMLVNQSQLSVGEEEKISDQAIIELSIPSLENALGSKDSETRWIAIGSLGDFTNYSDDCLERLRLTLPKLRESRQDENENVRRVAKAALNNIFYHLTTRGKSLEIRESAIKELEQLNRE